jgi:hypothetical protein
MGLTFTKKAAQSATEVGAAAPKKTGGVTFLLKGTAAKAAVHAEAVKAEARREAANRMRSYWLPYNGDGQITFLDGTLDGDGILEIPRFYQHSIQVGSGRESFVCTGEIDTSTPCPLCAAGDKPSLVGVMTVIDHSQYTVTKGPNAGKVYKNQRRLFVAKEGTLASLQKLAAKPERNGLALCTFDVSRGPENKRPPGVGDTFDFVMKHKSLAAIAEKYEMKLEECQPAIYDGEEGEIVYRTPAQLIELGLGKPHTGVGYEKGVSAAKDDL